METIISQLFGARDTAHLLHLKTKSFAQHLALGELYDGLLESADTIAEIYQGKYGILDIPSPELTFSNQDSITFITSLSHWAEETRNNLKSEDTNIINEWDSLLSLIHRTKYKLENLA